MNRISLLCATAALVMPVAIHAQETTSSIRGSVTSGGTPVAGAEVTIVNVPSGTTSRLTTDAEGNFSAQGLRVGGPYTVTVTSSGAETFTTEVPSLTAGQPFIVPIDLAEAGEAIVVTGTRGPRREQSQGPITTLTREEIEGVASVSRDVRDIARRDPFANIDQSNSRAVEIAGNNARLNRFSVDGLHFSTISASTMAACRPRAARFRSTPSSNSRSRPRRTTSKRAISRAAPSTSSCAPAATASSRSAFYTISTRI
jgi:hypothetical protein